MGSDYERDAFKFVVEWLHGDRVAYANREGTIQTKADWSNGNVARPEDLMRELAICGGNNRSGRFEDDHSNRRNCRLVFPAEYAGSTALLAERSIEQFSLLLLFQPLS